MGIAKRINWQNIFLFLFLIVFPFGQIIRLSFNIGPTNVPLLPIDIIVGFAALFALIKKLRKIEAFKSLISFVWVSAFSFLLSIFIFKSSAVFYGLFYLLRLIAYVYFLLYVGNFVKDSIKNKKLLIDSLLGVSVSSAIFGWIQFFMMPDFKAFFVYGWDIHLFRLVGTFFDPTFLGLIIVFGLMISITRFIDKRNWKNGLITFFLFISLAFTYSRASYLAFFAGILAIIYLEKKFKKLLLLIVALIIIALLLPTAKNHSIELFRTFSAIARIENYKTTLMIFSKNPALGVGYNNMCLASQKYLGNRYITSHACSGSDSSILLILATTGVVGLMAFVSGAKRIAGSLKSSQYRVLVLGSAAALLTHSLFSNSLFYSWIMGFFVILLAVAATD